MRPPDPERAAAAAETAADERVSLASNKANGSTGFQAITVADLLGDEPRGVER